MTDRSRRLLLVGGTGGLLGRSVGPELLPAFTLRSVHRHPSAWEGAHDVEWVAGDVTRAVDWGSLLDGVDGVVTLAWYRWGPADRFRRLYEGLHDLLGAARSVGVRRFVHVSVPDAPTSLERGLPYLVWKRRFDAELRASGLSYRILRPTAMFGPGDVLLGVMMRMVRRYPFFPLFGSGEYHLSPIAADDVARAIHLELDGRSTGTVDLGGPTRYRYRDLVDLMFRLAGKRPRYLRLSPRASLALARLLQGAGSKLLYAYEVTWLLSDLLGPPPYAGLDRPLRPVEPYLRAVAAR